MASRIFRDTESSFSKNIILIDQSSWLPWINIIKSRAVRGCRVNVWKYIDPSITSQPELPAIPRKPKPSDIKAGANGIIQLDDSEFAKFQYIEQEYKERV